MSDRPKKVGNLVQGQPRMFVQTDKSSHEAWARLCIRHAKAAGLLHMLIAQMNQGRDPVVVASQTLLAKMMGVSRATIKRAIKVLNDENWIDTVQLGPGTVAAYRINSRAAWTAGRDELKYSKFNGLIIADWHDQTDLKDTELRRIPSLHDGEFQLPAGDGEEPPSQPALDGMEPDLPTLHEKNDADALEEQDQQRLLD